MPGGCNRAAQDLLPRSLCKLVQAAKLPPAPSAVPFRCKLFRVQIAASQGVSHTDLCSGQVAPQCWVLHCMQTHMAFLVLHQPSFLLTARAPSALGSAEAGAPAARARARARRGAGHADADARQLHHHQARRGRTPAHCAPPKAACARLTGARLSRCAPWHMSAERRR